jgi:membrane protein required for colicin V production
VTAFDAIVLIGLLVSAAVGFSRGAVRELVALFAFSLAALGSLASLPATAALARGLIHPPWLAAVAAALGGFVVIFLILGLIARLLTAALDRRAFLGGANRAAGLGFGLLRALVLIGLFGLVFARVTPRDLRPGWIVGAQTYPFVALCGRLMQAVAPEGAKLAGTVPGFGRKVFTDAAAPRDEDAPSGAEETEAAPSSAARARGSAEEDAFPSDRGYTRRARKRVDDLVESSR